MRWLSAFGPMLALLAGLPSPLAAAPAAEWQPVGSWAFDTKRERCAASRTFQQGSKRITLGFKLWPIFDGIDVLLEAEGDPRTIRTVKGRMDFGAGRNDSSGSVSGSANQGRAFYELRANRSDVENLVRSQWMSIAVERVRATVSMAGVHLVFQQLEACRARLLSDWGLSLAEHSRLATFPRMLGDWRDYISSNDYPSTALNRSAIGSVEVRTWVDAFGIPSNCHVVRSSGHEDIDAASCKAVLRMRFDPAVDRAGDSMPAPYHLDMRWILGH